MRILIADGSVVSRHLLDATLRKWGFDVTVAKDGAQAWNILETPDAPSMAILEWSLYGFAGPEICRMVRGRESTGNSAYTYILLLTSKAEQDERVAGMEAGADDYLTKPFEANELKARLRAGVRILDLQRELVAARDALREQATRDSLTRIWNRSAILDIAERALLRCNQQRECVGYLVIDIDRFKLINDTYGHPVGGLALSQFAARIAGILRPSDAVGRWGGDEFLVVLPGANDHHLLAQAERMRSAIVSLPFELEDQTIVVHASLGAASVLPTDGTSVVEVIRAADDAMYIAKRLGGNRVHLMR